METLRMLLKLIDFVASVLGAVVLVLFFWAGFYWTTHPIPTTEEYYQRVYGARETWVKAVREREARQRTERPENAAESGTAGCER
ncbi:MAG: hypothetical protein GXP27_07240 [Planctomycetes bacterium]|nr:hypothetical protein [Planctomycetota bacterium]